MQFFAGVALLLLQKCSTAGSGIAANHIPTVVDDQVCFGIDYDFGSHKCYFHTDPTLCPELLTVIPTPVQLVEAPSVVNILLCEFIQQILSRVLMHSALDRAVMRLDFAFI